MSVVLPEHLLKLMDPAERAKLGPGNALASDAQRKLQTTQEKAMHEEVRAWLQMKGIPFIHARMDKPSTIAKGWPDLTCMLGEPMGPFFARKNTGPIRARVCCVELKAPAGILSESQAECIAELRLAHVPVIVAYSAKAAIDFIIGELLT